MEEQNNSKKLQTGKLSVRHNRTGVYYYLDGVSISKKEFFKRLETVEDSSVLVKIYRMLAFFAGINGSLGTLLLILAVLLKFKGIVGLAIVVLAMSIIEYVLAAFLAIKGANILDNAIEIYNSLVEREV